MSIKNSEISSKIPTDQLNVDLKNLQWSLESLGATDRLAQRVLIQGIEKQIRDRAVPLTGGLTN